jgi:hypothetical protein
MACKRTRKVIEPVVEVQAPLSRKSMSISQTVSDLTGKRPVNRGGKATGRGAFQVQCAEAIRAAYYLDLAARDYILADGAIEPVIERVPSSAFIEPSQGSELTFYGQSDRLQGRKHAADGGKFRLDLQERNRPAMKGERAPTRL